MSSTFGPGDQHELYVGLEGRDNLDFWTKDLLYYEVDFWSRKLR